MKPYTDKDVENLRRSVDDVRSCPPTPRVVRRLLATLSLRTRERDEALAEAALLGGLEEMAREEAERMLRSACDLRDALDIVASHLGVDTSTDAATEARACIAAVAALREEVERLRYPTCAAARSVTADIERLLDAIDGATLPSQEQPADALGEPGPCGHEVTSPAPWCEECVRGDDDADPTKWQPGDVVALPLPGSVSGTLLERVEFTSWPGWPMHWTGWLMHWNGGQVWLSDDLARDQGWRRIRRASTEERRG